LRVVAPGGATTDVHSVASGEPSVPGVIPQGLPEPRVKRTVEGDLGMRHNAATVVEAAGIAAIAADAGIGEEEVKALVKNLTANAEHLPVTTSEKALDHALARAAVGIAVQRHCGT